MELHLIRKERTEESTIGELYLEGCFFCYTLEDKDRQYAGIIKDWDPDMKVYGKTAIPYGKYEIIINWSNKFQKPMPLLLNTPDFEGIRIHGGNTAEDTFGCILVGATKKQDFIGNSAVTFRKLFPIIRDSLKVGKVWITITCPILGA